jgi:transcriptional accessory protein Tex/SPT6
MSYKYIKNPLEAVAVGDVIDVRILKVKPEKDRIGLSMLLEGEKQKPQPKPEGPPRQHDRHRDHRDRRERKPEKPRTDRIGNTPRLVVDTRKKK